MNNFEHPLKQHPVCKLAVDGAKRIKCGVLKARRAAVDAPFVLDMWRVCAEMRGLGIYSIVNRRAKCFTQLAFEAALRGGEVCGLKVCDLIFTACGPRCGLECKALPRVWRPSHRRCTVLECNSSRVSVESRASPAG